MGADEGFIFYRCLPPRPSVWRPEANMALARIECEIASSPNSDGIFFNCFEKVQKVDEAFPLCPDTAQAVWSGDDEAQ